MKKNIDDKQQQAPSTIEISTIFNLPNSSWCVFNNPLYRLLHRKNEQKPHTNETFLNDANGLMNLLQYMLNSMHKLFKSFIFNEMLQATIQGK